MCLAGKIPLTKRCECYEVIIWIDNFWYHEIVVLINLLPWSHRIIIPGTFIITFVDCDGIISSVIYSFQYDDRSWCTTLIRHILIDMYSAWNSLRVILSVKMIHAWCTTCMFFVRAALVILSQNQDWERLLLTDKNNWICFLSETLFQESNSYLLFSVSETVHSPTSLRSYCEWEWSLSHISNILVKVMDLPQFQNLILSGSDLSPAIPRVWVITVIKF